MKTILIASLALAAAISATSAEEKKTIGEKTADTLEKAGEKTKEVGRAVVDTTKDAGRAVVDTTKQAATALVDAVTPDKDARKIDVNLLEHRIDMPKSIEAGKTAFVVRNGGKEKHNFKIQGEGVDKKFLIGVDPNETKVLHVDLKPGTYKIHCPVKDHDTEGMTLDLIVK